MLKRIKQIKNKRLIVADALLVAALVIAFAVTYDISKHAGLYLLSRKLGNTVSGKRNGSS